MIRRIQRSFPAKLLVASLLVAVLVGGYVSLTAAATTEEVRTDARAELTGDAQQAASIIEMWLDRTRTDIEAIANAQPVIAGDAEGIRSYFERYGQSHDRPPGVVGYGYVRDGTYVGATRGVMVGTEFGAPEMPNNLELTGPYEVGWRGSPVVAMSAWTRSEGTVVVLLDPNAFAEAQEMSDRITVTNGDREFLRHADASMVGSTHPEIGGRIPALAANGSGTGFMSMESRVMALSAVEKASLVTMVHEDTEAAFSIAHRVESALVGTIFLGLVGFVIIGATVGSSTVISLRQLSTRAQQMADGDLDVSLESRRVDEFGDLYGSLAVMRDNLRERIEATEQAKEEAQQARTEAERERREAEEYTEQLRATAQEYADTMQAAADGDLTRRLDTEDRSEVMTAVGEEFNEMLTEIEETTATLVAFAEEVGSTAVEVEGRAEEVRTASQQVADSVTDIQTGAREQDDSLEDVARKVEDLSASAQEIAATTDSVAETSRETAAAVEAGEEAATEALAEMDDVVETAAEAARAIEALDDEMGEIGEIVDVIQSIAEETNMLALNASIEAARAGEGGGGQGFAVVAEEVKSLSEETKQSADEIEQRIGSVQTRTGEAVETVTTARERVQETATTVENALTELETIAERVEENDQSIQEISSVTSDQADAAQSASRRIDEVADISRQTVEETTEVSTAVDQQTEIADEVRTEVADLREKAEGLQDLLAQFVVESGTDADAEDPAGAAGDPGRSDGDGPAAGDGTDGWVSGESATTDGGSPRDGGDRA